MSLSVNHPFQSSDPHADFLLIASTALSHITPQVTSAFGEYGLIETPLTK